jgi:CRP-like cAMP-binding protein
MFTFWDVLEKDWKWGRDTWLFDTLFTIDLFFDFIFLILTLMRQRITVLDSLTCMETVRPRTLAVQELKSKGFWIDLLTCIPSTLFVVSADAPRVLLLNKILRMRHLGRRRDIYGVIQEHDFQGITKMLLGVMLAGHLLSCFYFSLTTSWTLISLTETSGVQNSLNSLNRMSLPRHPIFQLTEAPYGFFDFYTFSLRASTYLILGADLEGFSLAENHAIFFCTLLGVGVNAYVFSQIIVVISRRSTLETQNVEESNNTREAMRTLNLPSTLQLRILAHYTYERVHRGHGAITKLLGGLSEQLNFELHLARHYKLVTNVPFFKRSHPFVLREIVLVLADVIFLPGDWVCRLGDEGKEMYFLHKGVCSVLSGDLACLRQVKKGDYFGEISLLTGVQRTAFVRSDTFCMMAELSKDKFDHIMRRFPQELQVIVTNFSEEQKTLLLNIRQQLRAAREATSHESRRESVFNSMPSSVLRGRTGELEGASKLEKEGDQGSLMRQVSPGSGSPRNNRRNSRVGSRRTSRGSSGDFFQEEAEPDGYKAPVHNRQVSGGSSDSDESDDDEELDMSPRRSVGSRRSSTTSGVSHKSRVSHKSVSDKAKNAVAAILPFGKKGSNTSSTEDASLSCSVTLPTAEDEPQVTGGGSKEVAPVKQSSLKSVSFMRSVVSRLRGSGRQSAAPVILPVEEQAGSAQPCEDSEKDAPKTSSSRDSASAIAADALRIIHADTATSVDSASSTVASTRSIPTSNRIGETEPAATAGAVPASPSNNAAARMMRRPSFSMSGLLQRSTTSGSLAALVPGDSQSASSSKPQFQRRSTLANLAASISFGGKKPDGEGGGIPAFLQRRKSLAGAQIAELKEKEKAPVLGLDMPLMLPLVPEPVPERKKEAVINLDHVNQVVNEVSDTAQEIHDNSEKADSLTTDVQSSHQMVYSECARMEEIWLIKRAEIRQERRDITATIEHLIAQVTEAQDDLLHMLSDDAEDEVQMQAFNLLDQFTQGEQTPTRKPMKRSRTQRTTSFEEDL